jgi:hypothetical protein
VCDPRTADLLRRPVATTSRRRCPPRAEVDDVVGAFDDFEIVLDDEHAVALLHEPIEDAHELRDVVEVQPGRRFVEDEQAFVLALIREPLDELEPLRFAAGKTFSGCPSVR